MFLVVLATTRYYQAVKSAFQLIVDILLLKLLISDLEDGQVRCGEHSDYGSITLLFQGEGEGGAGLQVTTYDHFDYKLLVFIMYPK